MLGAEAPEEKKPKSTNRFTSGVAFFAVVWVAVILWMGAAGEPIIKNGYQHTDPPTDYYNLLVDGFRTGHTWLSQAPHPDLLSDDPVIRRRAPYLLDAALYRGHYYLYYGVTPAVVLLLPYTVLTGHHLSLNIACVAFAILGLAFSSWWLIEVNRRFERTDRFASGVIAAAVVGVVPSTLFLVKRSEFYDLPIVAGYACCAALLLFLWKALLSPKPARWLVLTAISFGLAVGCRANLILGGVALLAVFLGAKSWRTNLQLWAALTLPVLAIGLALAIYNFERFGSLTDFGFDHGINSFFETKNPLFAWRFIPFNLKSYFIQLPSFSPRFPYLYPIGGDPPSGYSNAENLCGFFPITLLLGWLLLTRTIRSSQRDPLENIFVIGLAVLTAAELGFTLGLGIRAYRYATDFLTPIAFGLGWLSLQPTIPSARKSSKAVTILLLAIVSLQSILGATQLFDIFSSQRPQEFGALRRTLTPNQKTLQDFGAPPPGPLQIEVAFNRPEVATIVPLVTTGLPHEFDEVCAIVHPSGYFEFEINHSGYGGPRSALMPVEWGRKYLIQFSLGSFYPDLGDPFFRSINPDYAYALKSTASVIVDGKEVMHRRMKFYESASWVRLPPQIHRSNAHAERATQYFSFDRLSGPPTGFQKDSTFSSIYNLELALPPANQAVPMPLLQCGIKGAGNLLFFDPLPSGQYRLAVDEWGHGLLAGGPFEIDCSKPHTFQIVAGPAIKFDRHTASQLSAKQLDRWNRRLVVWCDGRVVANFLLTVHLAQFDTLLVGANQAEFSSTQPAFTGQLREREVSENLRSSLLGTDLDAVDAHR